MFDMEKMMKPLFEKHIPSIVEAFERNKKKDYLMRIALKEVSLDEKVISENIQAHSTRYDAIHELVVKELKK